MADSDDPRVARLQGLLAELTERRFAASLTEVEAALARWRGGAADTAATHQAVVAHVERSDGLMRQAVGLAEQPADLVAAARDAGLLDEDEAAQLLATPLPPLVEAPAAEGAPLRPSKRAVAEALLAKGPMLIHLDARRPGVAVPPRFAGDPKLVLRFGYHLSPPISDLIIDDVGVAGTLVFGGVPFGCVLPWTAIFALVQDGESRGMVWPEDAPTELAVEPSADDGEPEPEPDPPRTRSKRPSHLRLVD